MEETTRDTTPGDEDAMPTPDELEDLAAADPAEAPAIAEKLADRLETELDRSEDDPPDRRSH